MHISTLKNVRQNEKNLTVGMAKDWVKIQEMIRKCKNGEEIDYSSFKLNFKMICLSLKVERDGYL
ncbi:hypothetical protein [Litchfieldia alkalitelluris]|uniref:hypothetical protein n=1 Tax=Litchfieldia alkalitelluris TaxID=304268 RepID=UPI000996196A|nr:hypothetical protein [Litchfieldia alkalitelluris]